MAEVHNAFAGRSDDWRQGYEAGIAAMQSEMRGLQERGLITPPAEVERMRAALVKICEVVGTSTEAHMIARRSLSSSETSMGPLELHLIEVALGDFYSEADVSTWLNSPHPQLEGRKAIDCRADEVWPIIDRLRSGAFV